MSEKNISSPVFLLLGTTEKGLDCYYIVRANPGKQNAITALSIGRRVNITELGEVMQKGYGDPPEDWESHY